MKQKIVSTFLMLCIAFLAGSCDDAGVTVDKKNITFSQTGLKPLNQQSEGVYEAWISLSTSLDHGDDAYISVGRFNISSTGGLLDTSGGTGSLNLNSIPDVNATEDAIITIELPGDNDTIPGTRVLGGAKVIEGGFVVFNMTMDYSEVLPISNQFSSASAQYLLASPTEQFASFNLTHGIWFTLDTNGSAPGLTLPSLPDTAEWTYQAWVVDNRDSVNRIYNIGRFTKSNDKDDNQQCEANPPAQTWLLPGHDWIQTNCPGGGIPDIDNLNNSNFKVMITLEPKFETGGLSKPFFIRLFYGNLLVTGPFGSTATAPNTTVLPTAKIKLSVTR
jgi:hypothetical protein